MTEDVKGYNGCQLWDTAFGLRAIVESGVGNDFPELIKRGHNYLEVSQVREDIPNLDRYYRHISKGGKYL